MIRKPYSLAFWSVPFILIMLITGCKHTPEAMNNPTGGEVATSPSKTTVTPPEAPPKEPTVDAAASDQKPVIANPNDKVSLASNESSAKTNEPNENPKPAATKPKIDIQDPFNEAKPTLLGLTLKSSPQLATSKYGKPKDQFQMDDDSDPITVYDYVDFLIGYNTQNQLQFIDIRSSDINPGLNGLRLGQSTSEVFKALGKPDSNTSYVMTYKSTGGILKLDIDPKSDKVNSIKLFAE
ncbi:DUF4309 domain-containing protein [Paenibacillus rigui]|uniref:DUF4309 domain-containing protein n=1 Tax=Paenibacillus rigui TaxID=554312 RepID=A0A229UL08_9BACL|nr:DUF4309 domain-containing protein [Paenibacillus rigui]OXM84090.1 DUF4309 domain-containing protein [Paenibacillus rigui]